MVTSKGLALQDWAKRVACSSCSTSLWWIWNYGRINTLKRPTSMWVFMLSFSAACLPSQKIHMLVLHGFSLVLALDCLVTPNPKPHLGLPLRLLGWCPLHWLQSVGAICEAHLSCPALSLPNRLQLWLEAIHEFCTAPAGNPLLMHWDILRLYSHR